MTLTSDKWDIFIWFFNDSWRSLCRSFSFESFDFIISFILSIEIRSLFTSGISSISILYSLSDMIFSFVSYSHISSSPKHKLTISSVIDRLSWPWTSQSLEADAIASKPWELKHLKHFEIREHVRESPITTYLNIITQLLLRSRGGEECNFF